MDLVIFLMHVLLFTFLYIYIYKFIIMYDSFSVIASS